MNKIYVGCTNDITRRKDQHNENARKRKSKFGIFLNDNQIKLTVDDFNVLHQVRDRLKGLKIERDTAVAFEKSGFDLLNDNYSKDCSRKGKWVANIHSSFEWVLVDFQEKKATKLLSLRNYCNKNGLNYRGIHRTSRSGHHCENRYVAIRYEDWKVMSNKERQSYISGEYLKDVYSKVIENHIERQSKTYKVIFPDGREEIVKNLDKFAREHNINDGNLHNTVKIPTRTASGYRAIRID